MTLAVDIGLGSEGLVEAAVKLGGTGLAGLIAGPSADPDADQYVVKTSAGNPESVTGGFRMDWYWRTNGSRAYTIRDSSHLLDQYDVSPAWSLLAADWTSRVSVASGIDPRSVELSPDGTELLRCYGSSGGNIVRNDPLPTPYDITVIGGGGTTRIPKTGMVCMRWKPDGTEVTIMSGAGALLDTYTVSTPFIASSIVLPAVRTFDMTVDAGAGVDTFAYGPDGLKLYSVTAAGLLCSWDLGTAYEVDTAGNFVTGVSANLPTTLAIPRGMIIRPDTLDIFLERDQSSQNVRCWEVP